MHALIDERAVPADLRNERLAPPTAAEVDRLRRELWNAGSSHPDREVRDRFLTRYPLLERFDAWALKELLGLTPEQAVLGIDRLPAVATVGEALSQGARQPDDDRRNQDRFAHDPERNVRRDAWGRPLPADPAQLQMGPVQGGSSQAWAHYGFPRVEWSQDPEVLKKDPRRWNYAAEPRAFAAHFAQMHTDLAICAATLGEGVGPALGWLYLGHAHHYLGDVANQIHTIQAIYDFFFDAKLESWKEELYALGGLLRPRLSFVEIGTDIVANHHFLAENLFSKRVAERTAGKETHPVVAQALASIAQGEGTLEQALDARHPAVDDEFARVIAEEVIDASSREGADVYRLVREIAQKRLSRAGVRYPDGEDPDHFVRKKVEPETLERFYRLQATGFARAGTAIRRHTQLFQAAVGAGRLDDAARRARFDVSARRLIATQLALLDAGDARLAAWQPSAPEKTSINWLVPGGLAVVVLVIGTFLVRRIRRQKVKRL